MRRSVWAQVVCLFGGEAESANSMPRIVPPTLARGTGKSARFRRPYVIQCRSRQRGRDSIPVSPDFRVESWPSAAANGTDEWLTPNLGTRSRKNAMPGTRRLQRLLINARMHEARDVWNPENLAI